MLSKQPYTLKKLKRAGVFSCTLLCFMLNQNALADDTLDVSLLSLNDIAYLWPTPKDSADVDALMDAESLISDGEIWSQQAFDKVIDFAENNVNGVDKNGNVIKVSFVSGAGKYKNQLKDRKNWKVVGFRVDPSAPSTSPKIIKAFGSIPQIRLILQPVTVNDAGVVTVHDYAAHLPFDFITSPQLPAVPDKTAFTKILKDLLALKASLKGLPGSESMDGPLKVNTNLSNHVFADKVKAFLHDHLIESDLHIIAFMGIAHVDQWVFFSINLLEKPDVNTSPNSQLLHVKTSISNTSGYVGKRIEAKVNTNDEHCNGVSTAVLFDQGIQSQINTPVKCQSPTQQTATTPLLKDIPNIIANPLFSNVLNTDCVSCHSESTRRHILDLEGVKTNEFQLPELAPFVDSALLPTNTWNVRNFGWFTKDVMTDPRATISWRTANETASSLEFIKNNYSN